MTDDDLTTAYILGVEHIRDKLHKLADEIERLRAENERLREEIDTYKRNGIVDVTGSINYQSGYDDGLRAARKALGETE